MIQDISPSVFYNEFNNRDIDAKSRIFVFKGEDVLVKHSPENSREILLPLYDEGVFERDKLIFLFRIDNIAYFLSDSAYDLEQKGFSFENHLVFRTAEPRFEAFAGFTAYHLYCWYRDTVFCGRCAGKLELYDKERAMKCPACSNIIYPKISPAVIVGVIDNNRLLLIKYAKGYKKFALVAGYTEIGESAERTVEREVMEEVGMKVKNITYYKSQPWGISSSMLLGFFCETDGSSEIKLDKNELKEGRWFEREEILPDEIDISLTREMIYTFKAVGRDGCIR